MPEEKKRVINSLKETGFYKPGKMYDRGKVIAGIIVFIIVAALPFFYNAGKAAKMPEPKLNTPEILQLPEAERICVLPKQEMRENHMVLLDEWRDQVVREGNREYTGYMGKKYTVSLQNTCLECHSNYEEFCNECHQYTVKTPICWGCHIQNPKEWAG